ncbi:hypothetical protein SK128_025438 [Halocaridina rubra]|uniref:C2H2-type domain-containing protein n=1 Tax=Halocaridina rubra TaxID=373956 RepID=A0AAN8XCW9_HALRR
MYSRYLMVYNRTAAIFLTSRDLLMRLEGIVGGSVGVGGGGGGVGVTNIGMCGGGGGGVGGGPNVGGGDDACVVPCPVCSKRVQLSYLSLHLKRTHDSLEVRCPLCAKLFKNKHSLSVHQARYHPRNVHITTTPLNQSVSSFATSSTSISSSGLHSAQHHPRPPSPTYFQPSTSQQLPDTPLGSAQAFSSPTQSSSNLWYHTHLEEHQPKSTPQTAADPRPFSP